MVQIEMLGWGGGGGVIIGAHSKGTSPNSDSYNSVGKRSHRQGCKGSLWSSVVLTRPFPIMLA